MLFETIELKEENSIAIIFFNRPKVLNALNNKLLDELDIAVDKIKSDFKTKVLILSGKGDKAFVAGADIVELSKLHPLESKAFSLKGQKIFSKIDELDFPSIASINGYALGGGLEIALACDFIYSSEKAIFGMPEINLGLIPGFGGTQRLSRLIGENKAKELILTGKNITAQKALEYGIVNKIYGHDIFMKEVLKTAELIAQKGKIALRTAKQAIRNGLNVDLKTGLHIENNAFGLNMASMDAKEGTMAFLEKREPNFKDELY